MKKIIILLMFVSLILVVSCTSVKYPKYNHGITVELNEKNYEVLGDVVTHGTVRSILGIFNWGGTTFYELCEKAKIDYGADDVINVSIDKKMTVFLAVYYSQDYIMRGIAIKYKE